ncbi:MAG: DNA-primase RepB domain-containing protein [Planctomycetota bacterium]
MQPSTTWDRGLWLSRHALSRQLAAMPCDRYLIRLIHYHTRRAFPGQRLWTAAQVTSEPMVRFLRARNRDGFDVYFQPYGFAQNAGYILVDLDHVGPTVLDSMRLHGHEPCVVIQTSPGRLQCWIQVSAQPLPAAVATAIGKQLARLYQGDLASTDWHHLGRLAGFTNQKPQRRLPGGSAPWVKVQHARLGLASNGRSLLEAASCAGRLAPTDAVFSAVAARAAWCVDAPADDPVRQGVTAAQAAVVYQTWLNRLRIPQRFPDPDWSIADLWIAKQLLLGGTAPAAVKTILRLASPQFPRRHAAPEDYLRRTLARATRELAGTAFPARGLTLHLPPNNPHHSS